MALSTSTMILEKEVHTVASLNTDASCLQLVLQLVLQARGSNDVKKEVTLRGRQRWFALGSYDRIHIPHAAPSLSQTVQHHDAQHNTLTLSTLTRNLSLSLTSATRASAFSISNPDASTDSPGACSICPYTHAPIEQPSHQAVAPVRPLQHHSSNAVSSLCSVLVHAGSHVVAGVILDLLTA